MYRVVGSLKTQKKSAVHTKMKEQGGTVSDEQNSGKSSFLARYDGFNQKIFSKNAKNGDKSMSPNPSFLLLNFAVKFFTAERQRRHRGPRRF